MRYRDGRRSICVSSQSGCPLTCTFCATGADEVRAQPDRLGDPRPGAALPRASKPDRPLRVHGHGRADDEPRQRARRLRALPDVGITHRRTAISTVGWIPGIERLAEQPMPLRLALSLHAADEALRSELMPVNDRYPLADVLEACRAFYERKRRMVFVEYVMLAGVNDRYEQALALAARCPARPAAAIFKVNLIPYNPTDSALEGSTRESIAAFRAELDRAASRRPSASRAGATSTPPAASSPRERLSRGRPNAGAAGARLAGAQQPLAQLGLLLGGRVPARDVGQLVERAQAEQLQELGARAVQDRAELRAAGLLDQAALEQRGGRRVGADAADAGDLRARDRLQVGDDRERLGLGGRERGARGRLNSRRAASSAAGSLASVQPPPSSRSLIPRRPGAYCSASSSSAASTACSPASVASASSATLSGIVDRNSSASTCGPVAGPALRRLASALPRSPRLRRRARRR
jgi:hypothetical protein